MNIISAAFCGLRIKVVHGCFLAILSHFPTAMEEVLWEVEVLGSFAKTMGFLTSLLVSVSPFVVEVSFFEESRWKNMRKAMERDHMEQEK